MGAHCLRAKASPALQQAPSSLPPGLYYCYRLNGFPYGQPKMARLASVGDLGMLPMLLLYLCHTTLSCPLLELECWLSNSMNRYNTKTYSLWSVVKPSRVVITYHIHTYLPPTDISKGSDNGCTTISAIFFDFRLMFIKD